MAQMDSSSTQASTSRSSTARSVERARSLAVTRLTSRLSWRETVHLEASRRVRRTAAARSAISKWTRSASSVISAARLDQPKENDQIVSEPLERRQLDSGCAFRVEQDQRILDRLEPMLDSKPTDVGDRIGGRGRPIADLPVDSGRRAGREVVTPSVRAGLHGNHNRGSAEALA